MLKTIEASVQTLSIEDRIRRVRSQKVMLDSDLAALYGVTTGALNQAVRRNLERFPGDFMFNLTQAEAGALKSQTVTAKTGRGGRRTLPYAFTEHGVAMLSGVLGSPMAIQVNLEIIRALIRLRRVFDSRKDLEVRLTSLEGKYDAQFKVVFDAIRELMRQPSPQPKRRAAILNFP